MTEERIFVKFLRECREKRSLKRSIVAKKIGVPVKVINSIEHCNISGIVRNIFERLIKVIIESGNKKDRSKAFNLLNQVIPKKSRRNKIDSKKGRMKRLKISFKAKKQSRARR
jgi:hypothetical protein